MSSFKTIFVTSSNLDKSNPPVIAQIWDPTRNANIKPGNAIGDSPVIAIDVKIIATNT